MNRPFVRLTVAALVIAIAGCAGNPDPDPEPEIVETPVRAAPPELAVAPGDCPEALRRALAKPDLAVDRVPSPKTNIGAVLRGRTMPTAVRRAKYNEVRVSVLVDTLGKADMKTFSIVKTTHPWLAESLKGALPKASFDPAMLAGCKVPRLWLGTFTSGKPPADTTKKG